MSGERQASADDHVVDRVVVEGGGADSDVIRIADKYYILATSSPTDDRNHVLKDGETFAIFDRRGDIRPLGTSTQGVYVGDTRFLSRCSLLVEGYRPLYLSSTVAAAGALLVVDLTNADIARDDHVVIPHGALHICRTIMMRDGVLRQRFKLTNYAPHDVEVQLGLDLDADFVDVFEVRGNRRERRGRYLDAQLGGDAGGTGRLVLGYRGLDDIERRLRVSTSPPADVTPTRIGFRVRVAPAQSASVHATFRCEEVGPPSRPRPRRRRGGRASRLRDACKVTSSSAGLEAWLERSHDDMRMMLTQTPHGQYPSAGVPWYATTFGRDGIITALETLWLDPTIARGVLAYLASTQATAVDKTRDAEPGKIIHEMRAGEMANTGEVPFGIYYGSVDSTPLFVMLAGAYLASTGDKRLLAELWPHVDAALRWMDEYGDKDGDGFLEYVASERGLTNQGWKDSNDAVFFEDGTLANTTAPPSSSQSSSPSSNVIGGTAVGGGGLASIALCEVQAYAYGARVAAARIARALGNDKRAVLEETRAQEMRLRFEDAFWLEDMGTYALALAGAEGARVKKRACRVSTSNAGQVLWTGIAAPDRARRVAANLLGDASFSGWGVRTVSRGAARYNPMAYHNGTIWPHDNAIIAAGLAHYGMKREATRVFSAMLDVTRVVDLNRLPELFCGFTRVRGKGPTLYPVACSPQAWSAGAVYMFLQASLGLVVDAFAKRVWLNYPYLPHAVRELDITGLRVGAATIDLALHRYPDGVGVDVRSRTGDVDVVMLK